MCCNDEGHTHRPLCSGTTSVSELPFDAVVDMSSIKRIEDVVVSNVPEPVVLDGEVLIDIAAAGVNFVDLLYVSLSCWLRLFIVFIFTRDSHGEHWNFGFKPSSCVFEVFCVFF